MDTDALIKMVKAKHAQSQSDVDKQIQEKLGQLSSKLSWVVEYPSQEQGQGQGQMRARQMMQHLNPNQRGEFMPGMLGEMEEGEEEDYDEDFDEDEMDEEELATLAYLRNKGKSAMVPGQGRGHFEGEIGEDEYGEDYDQEMEEFDSQHRVYNPMEEGEMKVEGYDEGGGEGSQDQGYATGGYQRTASPSLENYLMIGSVMAKCLVCNKIVRKSEVKQHNQLHDEEYVEEEGEEVDGGEEEGYIEGEEGLHEEEGYQEEGEGLHMGGEVQHEKEAEYEGEAEYEEDDYGGGEEEEFDMTEFTAEPLIAEKLDMQLPNEKTGKKCGRKSEQKSTVCDICNKTFKSHTNMVRHRGIHTDTKDFYCPVCHKSFRRQTYLNKHIVKMHPQYKGQAGDSQPGGGTGGDGDGGAVAQDGGAEETTEDNSQA